jgi:hypothetical protein
MGKKMRSSAQGGGGAAHVGTLEATTAAAEAGGWYTVPYLRDIRREPRHRRRLAVLVIRNPESKRGRAECQSIQPRLGVRHRSGNEREGECALPANESFARPARHCSVVHKPGTIRKHGRAVESHKQGCRTGEGGEKSGGEDCQTAREQPQVATDDRGEGLHWSVAVLTRAAEVATDDRRRKGSRRRSWSNERTNCMFLLPYHIVLPLSSFPISRAADGYTSSQIYRLTPVLIWWR